MKRKPCLMRILPVWFFVLFLAGLVLVLGACRSVPNLPEEPKISIDSVSITEFSFKEAKFLAKVNVHNNYAIAIPFPEMEWEIYIGQNPLIGQAVKKDMKISANSSAPVEVSFVLDYGYITRMWKHLAGADAVPYQIVVGARFPIPLIEKKTFTATFKGQAPLPKAPVIAFKGIKFNSLNPAKVEFTLTWSVDNKNMFGLVIDKLDYRLLVNNSLWASGLAPAGIIIGSRKSSTIPVQVSVNSAAVIQKILSAGKTISYSCEGELGLSSEGMKPGTALTLPFSYRNTADIKL
ncbi:MAG: LEA type 2 family protein [Treponema sp.]|jgi:LEA14-like dessication related protein|nr:LEA type 2 family protein [Treponema sp.]